MERIIDKNMYDQYVEDMRRYGIYVILRRAVADYRDGLKPVQRRILYTMYNDIKCTNSTVKSARIVGDVLGKYHPHGDSSAYGAMEPMANWYKVNCPSIYGQGNWGTIQGDKPAAMRYTEAKLSQFGIDCVIGDLQESYNVVDWSETYDNKNMEPDFLPVRVPLLLINGTFGIAFGIKCYIPPHNINEVIDATIELIDNPSANPILIPEQNQRCEIINTDFKSICNTGHGTFKVRGIIECKEMDYKNKGKRQALIIKSLPDNVDLYTITDKLNKLVESKKLIQIEDVRDDSYVDKRTEQDVLEYVIFLKKGADPNYVKECMYKYTALQSSYTVNFEVLVENKCTRLSYKDYINTFIEFRKLTKFRLYQNLLQQVETKLHEKDAYIKVLESGEIDKIIDMIKKQKSVDDTYIMEYLIKKLDITDLQAKFIINANLKKLSIGYLDKYKQEASELVTKINTYTELLVNEKALTDIIKQELITYKNKYGKPRLCKVVSSAKETSIPAGEFKIVITENNYIKKVQVNEIVSSYKGDNPKHILKVDNRESLLLFDDRGKVFKLPVYIIPFTDKNSLGIDVRSLCKNLTSNIKTVIYEPVLNTIKGKKYKFFVCILTKLGNIKKIDIEDLLSVPNSGIIYMKLDNNDYIVSVNIVPDKSDIIIFSNNKALRINIDEVPHQRRNTKGMKSMSSDVVDGLSVINSDSTDVVVLTNNGKINRFSILALPLSNRNRAGSKVIKLSGDDYIRDIYAVNIYDSIAIFTTGDKAVIPVSELPEGSSISAGKKFISTKNTPIIRTTIVKGK